MLFSLPSNMVLSLLAKQGKAGGLQRGDRTRGCSTCLERSRSVLHFWPGFFLATRGTTPRGPGSSSQYHLKVQFHITTAVTVALVMSARVPEFILSLLLKSCPVAGHCLLGCTGTARQGSELVQRRRQAPTSSAAEDPYGSVCRPLP